MVKNYSVKIADTRDYIEFYNGIFKLSPTEINILAEFVNLYLSLKSSSLNINPFSTDMKKKVAEKLGRDDFNTLNNYIRSLKKKGAIYPTTDGYGIHSMLVPMNEEGVKFKLDWINE